MVKGREFRIEVERVRSSTARVNIRGSTIRMRLPLYMSEANAYKTYSDFKGWAIRRLERMDHSQLEPKPRFIPFHDGQELEILGRRFTIRIINGSRRPSGRLSKDDTIMVRVADGLNDEERKEQAYRIVRRLITRSVKGDLALHMRGLNGRHFGFDLNQIRLRDQASRWGSCSRRTKNISLNFRILLAPDGIRDYVMIHELAHLKHPNHSERFWGLVSQAVPDYREKRRWLNKNGNKIGIQEKQEATGIVGEPVRANGPTDYYSRT